MTQEEPVNVSRRAQACPIWGTHCEAVTQLKDDGSHYVRGSWRVGQANYRITSDAKALVDLLLEDDDKARLTTWIIDRRLSYDSPPLVTPTVIHNVRAMQPLPVHERAERLLKFLARVEPRIGRSIRFDPVQPTSYWSEMAWSESTNWMEVEYLMDYLDRKGWIHKDETLNATAVVKVSVEGHMHIADTAANQDSSKCFVAMWFDPSMNEVYDKGIEPAVREAGFEPVVINRKQDVIGRLDDAIIAEIRRSRFLVADFTHGCEGVRGSVYYEAGYGHGLELPVVFTCREDMVSKVHFDTRQYNHIAWKDYDDLRHRLKDKILAAIGQGPNDA